MINIHRGVIRARNINTWVVKYVYTLMILHIVLFAFRTDIFRQAACIFRPPLFLFNRHIHKFIETISRFVFTFRGTRCNFISVNAFNWAFSTPSACHNMKQIKHKFEPREIPLLVPLLMFSQPLAKSSRFSFT